MNIIESLDMKNIEVILDKHEYQIAVTTGKKRTSNNKDAGVTPEPMGGKGMDEIDPLGFVAEYVWGKWANLCPDFTVGVRSKGVDYVTHFGTRIDIKGSDKLSHNLVVKKGKRVEDTDVYVLVLGSFPKFYIVGWAYSHEVIHPNRLNGPLNDTDPEPYFVKATELRGFDLIQGNYGFDRDYSSKIYVGKKYTLEGVIVNGTNSNGSMGHGGKQPDVDDKANATKSNAYSRLQFP
jgi:hypothetical protein